MRECADCGDSIFLPRLRYCPECKRVRQQAAMMWRHMNERAGNKDGRHPTYKNVKIRCTREEFYAWVIPRLRDFAKNHPGKRATVDRTTNGHYDLKVMRIVSMQDNIRNSPRCLNLYAPPGKGFCRPHRNWLGAYLPLSEFHVQNARPNKRQARCKKCKQKIARRKRRCDDQVFTADMYPQ